MHLSAIGTSAQRSGPAPKGLSQRVSQTVFSGVKTRNSKSGKLRRNCLLMSLLRLLALYPARQAQWKFFPVLMQEVVISQLFLPEMGLQVRQTGGRWEASSAVGKAVAKREVLAMR